MFHDMRGDRVSGPRDWRERVSAESYSVIDRRAMVGRQKAMVGRQRVKTIPVSGYILQWILTSFLFL